MAGPSLRAQMEMPTTLFTFMMATPNTTEKEAKHGILPNRGEREKRFVTERASASDEQVWC